MRRWMYIFVLGILILLLGVPSPVQLANPLPSVQAASQRLVVFEGFYSTT